MNQDTIREILEDGEKSASEKTGAILDDPCFKKESLGSSVAKEIVILSSKKINNDNQVQVSQLISEMIEVKINPKADDGDSHKASRAFLEAGIFDAEDLLRISENVSLSDPFMGSMPGMDRIIRYLCGLKN